MNLVCLSASNIAHQNSQDSASCKICQIVANEFAAKFTGLNSNIIELKHKAIQPCTGCGKCFETRRCVQNDDFNAIYCEIIKSDIIFIVSPHYAPIPAKLAALLEKMEQITFLHWGKDSSYRSEVSGKPTGVISHGGGDARALKSYKRMVNDTIANALDTIQMKLVPLNNKWDTGISLPIKKAVFNEDCIFPSQEYDWHFIADSISAYVKQIIKAR